MNKNETLLNAMTDINDTYLQEALIPMAKKTSFKKILLPIAAAFALTAVLGASYLNSQNDTPIVDSGSLPMGGISDTSPTEARKFFNYNGLRYAFEKSLIPEQYLQLDEELAAISADLSTDPQTLAAQDLAGTFAPGSKIYSIVGQSTTFRLAVSDETGVYVCQVTDTVPAGEMNVERFLEATDLIEQTQEIAVFDHFGNEFLSELDKTQAQTLLGLVSSATLATLESADYEKVAALQVNGGSFLIECKLADGTVYQLYAIPELGLVSLGDNKYQLSASAKAELAAALQL